MIKGKFIIKERIKHEAQDGSVTYTWGADADISYITKKKLVQAFGKVDSATNAVQFTFQQSELNIGMIAPEIAIDVPAGGITVYPFEGLYFQEGNDVKINDDGTLAIDYSIVGKLPNGSSIERSTGKLVLTENTNTSFTYNIVVTKVNGQKVDTISGSIYLGFKAPKIGDFAYADGTFSTAPNPNKTLIGMIYQVEESVANSEWKVCILGTSSVSGAFGADFYCYNTASKGWAENHSASKEQEAIFGFMKNAAGLSISMTEPDTVAYLGVNVSPNYEYDTDGIDRDYEVPSTLVDSGAPYTADFAGVGLNRLNKYINTNSTFKSTLIGKNYYSNNKLQNLNTISDIETVCKLFNEAIIKNFPSGVDYSKVLNPIYLKTSVYEPENLEGEFALANYSKGNWYIPSIAELELLIYYRILSTTKQNDTNIKSYWKSGEYTRGNSIFSNGTVSTDFNAFLSSDMIAAQASTEAKNYAYGETSNGWPAITTYGWYYSYPYVDYAYSGGTLDKCMRDVTRTVSPCCRVTITKK